MGREKLATSRGQRVVTMPAGQRHPSMPHEPGERVRVGGLSGTFEVVAFDGSLYRLRSRISAELKAGRRAVRLVRVEQKKPPGDDRAANRRSNERRLEGK